MNSYLKMMKHMVDLYRQYRLETNTPSEDSSEFAEFILNIDESHFNRMMSGLPTLFDRNTDPLFRIEFAIKEL